MTSVNKHKVAPQRSADTQHNVRDAALHGASLAFSKPPPKPKPIVNTYTGGGNGALLAATKVGNPQHGAPAGSPASLTADWTGGSLRTRPRASPMQAGSRSNSSQSLGVPDDHVDRGSSPSNIAARLAAARYSPLRPTPQATPSVMSERHANERDILPPSGSVGSVLARLETAKPSQQPRKRRDSLESQSAKPSARPPFNHHKPTDDTPIPPTTSLVKMFEQNRSSTPTKFAPVPLTTAQHSPPPVRSPKPQRTFKLPPEPIDDAPLTRQRTRTPPPIRPKPQHRIELPPSQFLDGTPYFHTPQKDPMKSPPIKQKPVQLAALRTSTPPPKPPPQRGTRQARPKSEDIKRSASIKRVSTSMHSEKDPESPASFKSAKEIQEEQDEKPKPAVPPPRRSNTRKLDTAPDVSRARSAAPVPFAPRKQDQLSTPVHSPTRLSPPRRPTSTSGTSPASVYHNPYQRDSVRQITKHMTGESLSSAIMGAALASSRNASPAPAHPIPIEPLFPPRKQHHHTPFHRSPSPPKQSPPKSAGKLRTTMRKEPSSSDDEDDVEKYKKKGSRILGIKHRKHPNKHHEGTRKRWRDQITDRERKRYEGVWAANKGLHLPTASVSPSRALAENDASQDVLNLVAQDIWLRSRLPVHVLEEVWDLVDSRAVGRLKRDEFVVGLWMIDQRLKGRKLPVKVSESVWTSARSLGVKIKVRG
ncbi:hypothetical protein CC86DRAFT_373431 [Ophiobolus disseminans]|uniref:EH domain-containing protein n=1 Tax=Ophiobolus disseminans TaxID=1469910 RepID=A0A6A6ZPF6_9PLEO|nr:hypothetical protein CC86DRAFT_373431 [Ophiobolus disseminans]